MTTETEKKLYMKYFVLKMEDRINIPQFVELCQENDFYKPKIRDIAEIILNCLVESE